MGSIERRKRDRDNLRRSILDAACNLFATGNYKEVSIRKIADAVEYSPAAIYLHFKDKDEILDTLAEEGFVLLSERLEAITATNPLDRLRAAGRVYIRFLRLLPASLLSHHVRTRRFVRGVYEGAIKPSKS